MLSYLIRTAGIIDYRYLAFCCCFCPLCGKKRFFLRLNDNEISVRCIFCKASSVTLSIVSVLQDILQDLEVKDVYELSSRGPLFEYLKHACNKLTCSEYYEDVPSGSYYKGVLCQDVQNLSFDDKSFDVCTSSEVFEHVPDDAQGFSEISRVLKNNGIFLFTVPINTESETVERAKLLAGGEVQHILPPEYHLDPLRGQQKILAFRNYGYDILNRLVENGFSRAEIRNPGNNLPWGYFRPVIVAYREEALTSIKDNDRFVIYSVQR